ncbi:MAG TPA: TrkA C-terminal domain-containing protein [Gemmatimonadales bacterium]|nr:TrkA C-terminal domain-containing protein [Gemmatimonadales bacterium]
MDAVRALLEAQPLLTLFLTIAAGYFVGAANIKGFSLGAGAVLFVALAIGAFAPGAVPPPLVGTLGLLLFLYCIGLAYGADFYRGLRSAAGIRANVAGLIGLAAAASGTLLLVWMGRAALPDALGLFAGAGTSTPALQAVMSALQSDQPAVGYSVAYPFGVAGPILVMYFYLAILKPVMQQPAGRQAVPLEVVVRNPKWFGRRFSELVPALPPSVRATAIREERRNRVPTDATVLDEGDVLLLVSTDLAALEQARRELGEAAPGQITRDRGDLDYFQMFVSSPQAAGSTVESLADGPLTQVSLLHVRRGDADLLPSGELVLELGDRVGLLCPRDRAAALRRFFGDSIRSTADISYVSIGVGAALGLLAGLVPIPIPGVGRLTLGFAGVLIVALTLGMLRRTAGLTWTIPLSANLILRNLGLTLFLAQVGLASGERFLSSVRATGPTLLLLGALLCLLMIVPAMVAGRLLFRLPADDVLGVVSGVTGNPAILSYAGRAAGTDRPDIVYATVFPTMTILKIIFVQVAAALLAG